MGAGGQNAFVGTRVKLRALVNLVELIEDTALDPSGQSRTQIDMAGRQDETRERGTRRERREPRDDPETGLERLVQELQDCLSAGNLPTRTPLAQRFNDIGKTSNKMKEEHEIMKGPGSTACKAAFKHVTGQCRDHHENQEGCLGRGIRSERRPHAVRQDGDRGETPRQLSCVAKSRFVRNRVRKTRDAILGRDNREKMKECVCVRFVEHATSCSCVTACV